MKTLKSYNVQVWCGLREQYTNKVHTLDDVRVICDEYVNEVKDCVTITPTEFRYVDGSEPGFIIGWIQYPRFPRERTEIKARAIDLGDKLMRKLGQLRVTITTPKESIMIDNPTPTCNMCGGTGVGDNDGYNLPCHKCRPEQYYKKRPSFFEEDDQDGFDQ